MSTRALGGCSWAGQWSAWYGYRRLVSSKRPRAGFPCLLQCQSTGWSWSPEQSWAPGTRTRACISAAHWTSPAASRCHAISSGASLCHCWQVHSSGQPWGPAVCVAARYWWLRSLVPAIKRGSWNNKPWSETNGLQTSFLRRVFRWFGQRQVFFHEALNLIVRQSQQFLLLYSFSDL